MKTTEDLLQELENNKQRLFKLVEKLEDTIDDVDKILPKKYDFKNRFVLIDRIQTLTQLYDSILKYRSEIAKQIKDQVQLSNSMGLSDDSMKETIINMSLDELKTLLSQQESTTQRTDS